MHVISSPPRASVYRTVHNIGEDSGVAIIIQETVFGNFNGFSGVGICYADSASHTVYGEFLDKAIGDELSEAKVPSTTTLTKAKSKSGQLQTLDEFGEYYPETYSKLLKAMKILEKHYHQELQYVEFTVQDTHLYILEVNLFL